MEVLISCFGERTRFVWEIVKAILQHLAIVIIGLFSTIAQFGAHKILANFTRMVWKVLLRNFDLWFRGEVHLVILRVIFDNPILSVKISQVLILVRIGMIIERIHSLIGAIVWF